MFNKMLHHPFARVLAGVFGAFLMAVGVNLFVIPQGLYSGGKLGLSQLLRTLLQDYLHLQTPFDLSAAL